MANAPQSPEAEDKPVPPGSPSSWALWLQDALMSTLIHACMVMGLLYGGWEAGESLVGILLDSLIAYILWLVIYLGLRPKGKGVREVVGKTFVGLSLGVWGFIAMFRAITLRDTALLAANITILEVLGDLSEGMGDDGGEILGIILIVVAAALLIASLYFLTKILLLLPLANVAWLVSSIGMLRAVQVVRYWQRHRTNSYTQKVTDAEDHLAELCLHVFVKGWAGAIIMYFFAGSALPLVWIYLAWSYGYDITLRRLLWYLTGRAVKRKILARAASKQTERYSKKPSTAK